jgi:hypothetical protein
MWSTLRKEIAFIRIKSIKPGDVLDAGRPLL